MSRIITTTPSALGDAVPADVVSPKTFSSLAAGVNKQGTLTPASKASISGAVVEGNSTLNLTKYEGPFRKYLDKTGVLTTQMSMWGTLPVYVQKEGWQRVTFNQGNTSGYYPIAIILSADTESSAGIYGSTFCWANPTEDFIMCPGLLWDVNGTTRYNLNLDIGYNPGDKGFDIRVSANGSLPSNVWRLKPMVLTLSSGTIET